MKKKILLPILLLAAMTAVACNSGSSQPAGSSEPAGESTSQPAESSESQPAASESQPAASDSSDPTVYGVAINNKTQLTGEWYKGTTRDLDITLTPAANALQEIQKKNLVITSSNPEIVAVTGLGLSALEKGEATITVKYHDVEDSVKVNILSNSAKDKYGVAHEGTAEDPFTNEDALAVAKSDKYEKEVYYVKGIVDRFYYAPGTNANNGTAYYLKAATENGEQFEIFKCFKEDGSQLSDDDIWVGGEATAYGSFTKYNSQYETSSAVFVSCTGDKPQPRQTLSKTFAETLALGVALKDGADSYDYIKFQGFVTAKEGNNFWLTATKGEALVKGKSDASHGERDINTNAIELYFKSAPAAEITAKLLEGAKVEVTMIVKNYHGTVENGNDLTNDDITVVEAGTEWAVPEPAVATRTLKEFIDGENTKAKAYNVTATVKSWKDATADKDKYGNMVLTDGTNDLVIYGASATATALAWDNSSAYAFQNPQDFLTNETTAALAIGDEVTMKLIRADYTKDGVTTIQGTGIITKVTPSGTPTPTYESFTLDYSALTGTGSEISADDALAKIGQGNAHITAVTASKIYDGNGTGGAYPNTAGLLKTGTGSAAGKIVFTLDAKASKVEISCHDWYKKNDSNPTNSNTVAVNGSETQLAPYNEEGTFGALTFELATASKEVTIDFNKRVFVKEIKVYYVAEAAPAAPEYTEELASPLARTWTEGTPAANSDGKNYTPLEDSAANKVGVKMKASDISSTSEGSYSSGKLPSDGKTVTYQLKAPKAGYYQMQMTAKVSAAYTLGQRGLAVTVNGEAVDIHGDRDGGLVTTEDRVFVVAPIVYLTGNEDAITLACPYYRIVFNVNADLVFAEI